MPALNLLILNPAWLSSSLLSTREDLQKDCIVPRRTNLPGRDATNYDQRWSVEKHWGSCYLVVRSAYCNVYLVAYCWVRSNQWCWICWWPPTCRSLRSKVIQHKTFTRNHSLCIIAYFSTGLPKLLLSIALNNSFSDPFVYALFEEHSFPSPTVIPSRKKYVVAGLKLGCTACLLIVHELQ